MRNRATFVEVDELAATLASPDQLKLAARICERMATKGPPEKAVQQEHLAWLRGCDDLARQIPGLFDSACDLREMRNARA
jgi:hypothetical protein